LPKIALGKLVSSWIPFQAPDNKRASIKIRKQPKTGTSLRKDHLLIMIIGYPQNYPQENVDNKPVLPQLHRAVHQR
jgi:hypothetical protein